MNINNEMSLKSRREVIGLIGVGITISIAGCSSSQKTAEETAQSYLEAKYNGDFEQAKSYTSGLEQDRIDEGELQSISGDSLEFESITSVNEVDSDIDVVESHAKVEYEDTVLSGIDPQPRNRYIYLIQKEEGWTVVKDTNESNTRHADADDAHEFDPDVEGSLANMGIEFVQGLHTNPEKSRRMAKDRDPVMNGIDRFHEAIEDHELESLSLKSIRIEQDRASVRVTAEHEPTYLTAEYDFPLGIEDRKVVSAQRI